ncbi:cupredoxin domain-containing protein [Cohnella soli]|uniref:Cupredoxin domain-containing protein n=1 Tax=Cohnella soli TaxID=425005 RepID=A0ABW0I092_9BACL
MTKRFGVYVLVLATAIALAGCGGKNNANSGEKASSSPSASQAAGAGAGAQTIEIDAKNFEFDKKEIKVKKGDTVNLSLKNSQGNHSIKIDGYDVVVKANKTTTFTADKAGEFEFVCATMCGTGHGDMKGKLIVE